MFDLVTSIQNFFASIFMILQQYVFRVLSSNTVSSGFNPHPKQVKALPSSLYMESVVIDLLKRLRIDQLDFPIDVNGNPDPSQLVDIIIAKFHDATQTFEEHKNMLKQQTEEYRLRSSKVDDDLNCMQSRVYVLNESVNEIRSNIKKLLSEWHTALLVGAVQVFELNRTALPSDFIDEHGIPNTPNINRWFTDAVQRAQQRVQQVHLTQQSQQPQIQQPQIIMNNNNALMNTPLIPTKFFDWTAGCVYTRADALKRYGVVKSLAIGIGMIKRDEADAKEKLRAAIKAHGPEWDLK